MADLAFSIAGTVLEKLTCRAYEKISSTWGMKDDLKKPKETTEILKVVLLDAEKKQEHDKKLRFWLTQLTYVFQDAQDALDEFECELLRRKVVKEHGSLGRKVRRFFSRSNPLVFHFSIAHRIKEIRQKLDEIVKEMKNFELASNQMNQDQRHLMLGTREMTHSYVKASDVIGRDADKEKIIEMLLNQDHNHSDDNISVISIVGIGGLGKTTLAKSVYNDERVIDQFSLRLWVCVPFDFNITETIREILKSAIIVSNSISNGNFSLDKSLKNTKAINNLSLDQLQMFLRSILKDKHFLLILDDIWNEDRSKWNELREVLTVGAQDSKIVVTTRNVSVASIMGTTPPHELQGLSEEDSVFVSQMCIWRGTIG